MTADIPLSEACAFFGMRYSFRFYLDIRAREMTLRATIMSSANRCYIDAISVLLSETEFRPACVCGEYCACVLYLNIKSFGKFDVY